MNHYHQPDDYRCPFCALLAKGVEGDDTLIYDNEHCLVALGLHHYLGSGPNLLVIPKQHVENLYGIPPWLLNEVMQTAQRTVTVLRSLPGVQGVTLRQNNEPAGNQDVWHFHVHVIARFPQKALEPHLHQRTPAHQLQAWSQQLRLAFAS